MKRHTLHDYSSAGAYFITFATAKRKPLLGVVRQGTMKLFPAGRIVEKVWKRLPGYYANFCGDAMQIMPDHVHCIMLLSDPVMLRLDPEACKGIPSIIKAFKAASAREINKLTGGTGNSVWQKGYFERIIRNKHELEKYRYYIETNALREYIESRE